MRSDAQWEAAYVLGYNNLNSLKIEILPQMLRHVLPPSTTSWTPFKEYRGSLFDRNVRADTNGNEYRLSVEMAEPVPIYLTVALFYLGMSALLNSAARLIEKRISYVKSVNRYLSDKS
jgi:ABC-type amino acid transport system permease subunit